MPNLRGARRRSLDKLAVLFLIPTLIALSENHAVFARQAEAFEALEIGIHYIANVNRNLFHDFYEPGWGVEGFVETPFYYGDIQTAIQFMPFAARESSSAQDFHGVFAHLKWGKQHALPYGARWFTGVGVGLYGFVPRDSSLSGPSELAHFTETELSASLDSRLSRPIRGRWTIGLGGSYSRVFTYKPIHLAIFSAGIGYAFKTPVWLREFLK